MADIRQCEKMGRRKSAVPGLLQRFNDIQTPMVKGKMRMALLESDSSGEDDHTLSRFRGQYQHGNTQSSSWNGKIEDTETYIDTDMDYAIYSDFDVKPSIVQQSIESVFPKPKSSVVHSMSAQAKKHRARRARLGKDALRKKEEARKERFKMSSTNNRAHQVPFVPSRPGLVLEAKARVRAQDEDEADVRGERGGPTPSPITSPERSSLPASTPDPGSGGSTKFTLISPTVLADLRSNNGILRSHNLSLAQRRREAEGQVAAERLKTMVLSAENEDLRGQVALLKECGIEWARRAEMLRAHVRGLVREKEMWEERGVEVEAESSERAQ